jgi:hypothetical protein
VTFASQDFGLLTAAITGTYTVTIQPEDAATGTQVLLVAGRSSARML